MPKSCKLVLAFTIQVSVKVVTQVQGILISKRKAVIGENPPERRSVGRAINVHLSMPIELKIRPRAKELPCFNRIPHGTKPFFKQWHIHAIDVTRIMTVNYAEARQVVSDLRSFYGKAKTETITVEEFCMFTGVGKSYVRMHLVARVMEGELKRQVSRKQPQAASFKP